MLPISMRRAALTCLSHPTKRCASTLSNNPHIHVFPKGSTNILTYLPTTPPTESLAIGTSAVPPTPDSFTSNPHFLSILQSVLRTYAAKDPSVLAQAQAFASTSGGTSTSLFNQSSRKRGPARSDGAGGANSQGGAGGGGRGGWVHVSDLRTPVDYGRIAWPEDIFGSLEVDGEGKVVGEDGGYQESGTYRVVTRDGILGLSDFLRERLVERLKAEESKLRS